MDVNDIKSEVEVGFKEHKYEQNNELPLRQDDLVYQDPNVMITDTVSLEEARHGLIKVIRYLQIHPPEEPHMVVLFKILDHLNKQVSSAYYGDPGDILRSAFNTQVDTIAHHYVNESETDTPLHDHVAAVKNNDPTGGITIDYSERMKCAEIAVVDKATRQMEIGTTLMQSMQATTACFSDQTTKPTPQADVSSKEQVHTTVQQSICDDMGNVVGNGKDVLNSAHIISQDQLGYSENTTEIKPDCNYEQLDTSTNKRRKTIHKRKTAKIVCKPRRNSSNICCICNKSFKTLRAMHLHLREHTELTQSHKCKLCGDHFDTIMEFQKHMTSKHYCKRYVCKKCGARFKSSSDLKEHTNVHSGKMLVLCGICRKKFAKPDEFEVHLRAHEQEKEANERKVRLTAICSICNQGFQGIGWLMRHLRSHKGMSRSNQCAWCDLIFDSARALKIHMHHIHTAKKHVCKECGKGFRRISNLHDHKNVHQPRIRVRIKKNICRYCRLEFEQPHQLTDHIKIHTGVEPYICRTCNATFSRSSYLRTHLMCHGDSSRHKCNICEKSYRHLRALDRHILVVHQGIKDQQCSTCGKCFTEITSLRAHQKLHTGEKNCVCKICGKAYTLMAKLNHHMKVHTNEHLWPCTVCGKKLSSLSVLCKHMQIHTGEKPYVCKTCGKRFSQGPNLKRHEVVHTGAKPYVCTVCGHGFTQNVSRRLHMKNVHGQGDALPDIKSSVPSLKQKDI